MERKILQLRRRDQHQFRTGLLQNVYQIRQAVKKFGQARRAQKRLISAITNQNHSWIGGDQVLFQAAETVRLIAEHRAAAPNTSSPLQPRLRNRKFKFG